MAFTFFFRDLPILEAAADQLTREMAGRSRVRIWNAGCAMGPETFSFLICLAERMGKFAFQNIILEATDIDEGGDFGQIIDKGEYSRGEIERIPSELQAKYFDDLGNGKVRVTSVIKDRVRFRKNNLLELNAPGTGYSMVICKNVLLHFSAQQRVKVVQMYADALAEGGFLVVEHTQKIPSEVSALFEPIAPGSPIYRRVAVAAKVAA